MPGWRVMVPKRRIGFVSVSVVAAWALLVGLKSARDIVGMLIDWCRNFRLFVGGDSCS